MDAKLATVLKGFCFDINFIHYCHDIKNYNLTAFAVQNDFHLAESP